MERDASRRATRRYLRTRRSVATLSIHRSGSECDRISHGSWRLLGGLIDSQPFSAAIGLLLSTAARTRRDGVTGAKSSGPGSSITLCGTSRFREAVELKAISIEASLSTVTVDHRGNSNVFESEALFSFRCSSILTGLQINGAAVSNQMTV